MHEAGDVLGVDDADDAVGVGDGDVSLVCSAVLIDWDAGVLLLDNAGAGAFDGQACGEGKDLAARGHDFADGDVVEFDCAMDDFLLKWREKAHAAGGGGDEFEFLRRVHGAFAAERRSEETQDQGSRVIHQADGGAGHADEDVHRAGHGEGNAFGALEGESLRNEFAQENFKIGDGGKGEDNGSGVRVDDSMGWQDGQEGRSDGQEHFGDGRLTEPAESQRGEGHAKLNGGEKLIDIAFEQQRRACAGAAQGEQLLHARFAHADEREFGSHEETVGQNEEGHHDPAEEHPFQHSVLSLASAPGWDAQRNARLAGANRAIPSNDERFTRGSW